jgi:hypothetical protein
MFTEHLQGQFAQGCPVERLIIEHINHKRKPVLAPVGADASSDGLRRRARCTACGRKGAKLQLPSWADSVVGRMPFPG